MIRSSFLNLRQLRCSIYYSQYFQTSNCNWCCRNHCTFSYTFSITNRSTNSPLFRNMQVLLKQINDVHNPYMCQMHDSALIDRSFKSDAKLRRYDKITNDFMLIYRTQNEKWYRNCYILSYTLSVIAPCLALRAYTRDVNLDVDISSAEIMEDAGNNFLMLTDTEYHLTVLALLVISTFMYVFLKRFPLRIYYNGKSYIAVFMNAYFPFLRTTYAFSTARKYEWPALFGKSLYVLDKRRARLFEESFRRPIDMLKMTNETSLEDEKN